MLQGFFLAYLTWQSLYREIAKFAEESALFFRVQNSFAHGTGGAPIFWFTDLFW